MLYLIKILCSSNQCIDDASKNFRFKYKSPERLKTLPIRKILPAHGSPDRIKAGGYDTTFIDATLRYIRAVDEPVALPKAWNQTLQEVVKEDVEAGNLIYFAQYEVVHQSNVEGIQEVRQGGA